MSYHKATDVEALLKARLRCLACGWFGAGKDANPQPDSIVTCPTCGKALVKEEISEEEST